MYVFVPIFPQINAIENCQLRRAYFIANAEIDIQSILAKHYLKNKKTSNQVKVCKLLNIIRNLLQ